MIKVAEGAEAIIYETSAFGQDLLLKRREQKKYRINELDERIRKERTRREARVMQRLNQLGTNSPRLVGVGKFSIYMEKLQGKLLKDVKVSTKMAKDAGTLLAKMHDNNIVHGDFTPANLMLCGNSIHVIDFGLSEISNGSEEKALDLLLMKRSIPRKLYSVFEEAYSVSSKKSNDTLKRLESIEKRGRYQIRTLA